MTVYPPHTSSDIVYGPPCSQNALLRQPFIVRGPYGESSPGGLGWSAGGKFQ